MIDRTHELPLTRQARVLKLSRSSLYYRPRPVTAADLAVMRRIDALHLDYPFAGSRMLRDLLNAEGVKIGREHVKTLMKKMGVEALYRRPNTSKPALGHKIYRRSLPRDNGGCRIEELRGKSTVKLFAGCFDRDGTPSDPQR